jgi:hypothetical protein
MVAFNASGSLSEVVTGMMFSKGVTMVAPPIDGIKKYVKSASSHGDSLASSY